MDIGAWWAIVHGVTRSWTQLNDYAHAHTQIKTSPFILKSAFLTARLKATQFKSILLK